MPKRRSPSTAWIWSKARTRWTSPYTSATARRTIITACSTRFASSHAFTTSASTGRNTPGRSRPTSFSAVTRSDAAAFADRLRAAGRTVVFTNGVFDLLHPGHVRYLTRARGLGDALIVGLNSDRSVRANKGTDRPIVPAAERAEILEAL